ncbi:MAG: hypothetical protein HC836_44180 [Richelia sp. RM2_1_2]|nr:hypothetical protein [Richelia sp. RM2_1_2]
MIKKTVSLEKTVLTIKYVLKPEHIAALFLVKSNNGNVSFKERSEKKMFDTDGLQITWKVCDELTDIGLLKEDEEAFDVFFEISELGEQVLSLNKVNV